jgi:hypothetical protein
MAYDPFTNETGPEIIGTAVIPIGPSAQMRELQAQQQSYATPIAPTGRPGALAYNSSTNEFSLGMQVLGTLSMNDIEAAAQAAVKNGGYSGEYPEGFVPIDHNTLLGDIQAARANPEADFGAFLPNLNDSLDLGKTNNEPQSKSLNAVNEHIQHQSFAQQASYEDGSAQTLPGATTNASSLFGSSFLILFLLVIAFYLGSRFNKK